MDIAANVFRAVELGGSTANHYGTYEITTDGNWTYPLDNANAAVNALNDGGRLTDSFVIRSQDSTEKTIDVTINGHTDAPVGPWDELLAIASMNIDGIAGYNPDNGDLLIARVEDTNGDHQVSAGDIFRTGVYPLSATNLASRGDFAIQESVVASGSSNDTSANGYLTKGEPFLFDEKLIQPMQVYAEFIGSETVTFDASSEVFWIGSISASIYLKDLMTPARILK